MHQHNPPQTQTRLEVMLWHGFRLCTVAQSTLLQKGKGQVGVFGTYSSQSLSQLWELLFWGAGRYGWRVITPILKLKLFSLCLLPNPFEPGVSYTQLCHTLPDVPKKTGNITEALTTQHRHFYTIKFSSATSLQAMTIKDPVETKHTKDCKLTLLFFFFSRKSPM